MLKLNNISGSSGRQGKKNWNAEALGERLNATWDRRGGQRGRKIHVASSGGIVAVRSRNVFGVLGSGTEVLPSAS